MYTIIAYRPSAFEFYSPAQQEIYRQSDSELYVYSTDSDGDFVQFVGQYMLRNSWRLMEL
jgi:hypothetical protein